MLPSIRQVDESSVAGEDVAVLLDRESSQISQQVFSGEQWSGIQMLLM